jgi:hypothetical protein
VAAGHVVAFAIAVGFSLATATAGTLLCRLQVTRSRRLLTSGTLAVAHIVEVVPQHPAGQSFPLDAARIVVEYKWEEAMRRETIVLARTPEERYKVGDPIDVLFAEGSTPHVRTCDEPNIAYGTLEQIAGAALLILAFLPLFIMFDVHALTP